MTDLTDLYQQVILDHNRNPRNFGRLETASRTAEGNNPLCGDRINLYVQLDGDVIREIAFQMPQGSGCAISKASASLMTAAVKGKTVADAEGLFRAFHDMVTGGPPPPPLPPMRAPSASWLPLRGCGRSRAGSSVRPSPGIRSAPRSRTAPSP